MAIAEREVIATRSISVRHQAAGDLLPGQIENPAEVARKLRIIQRYSRRIPDGWRVEILESDHPFYPRLPVFYQSKVRSGQGVFITREGIR